MRSFVVVFLFVLIATPDTRGASIAPPSSMVDIQAMRGPPGRPSSMPVQPFLELGPLIINQIPNGASDVIRDPIPVLSIQRQNEVLKKDREAGAND